VASCFVLVCLILKIVKCPKQDGQVAQFWNRRKLR
jgi:hypothetical protein